MYSDTIYQALLTAAYHWAQTYPLRQVNIHLHFGP